MINVRDGNSLLLKYCADEENKVESVTTLRCGLPRFFNLSADSVRSERFTSLATNEEQAYYQYETLAQVRRALMEGAQVELISSLKTNGDCAHLTWSTELDAWVITSQNVSIVAKNEKEVKTLYPEQTRYFLARKIALCWMRKLKSLSQERLDALKSDLAECVFVGDFIGNRELINLINYARETIMFHSVVRKSRDVSIARETFYGEPNSFEILQRHSGSIDVVPSRNFGTFSSYEDLCSELA